MEEYIVRMVELKTGQEFDSIIDADEAETTEEIVLETLLGDRKVSASDENYLPAFQKLRDQLLAAGYGIKCNGSRINAVQSGMMGASNKVYLVELGKQARMKDIVDLYDYADIGEFPDTLEQTAFFEKWTKSF